MDIVYDVSAQRQYNVTKHNNIVVRAKSLESLNCHVLLKLSRTALNTFGMKQTQMAKMCRTFIISILISLSEWYVGGFYLGVEYDKPKMEKW